MLGSDDTKYRAHKGFILQIMLGSEDIINYQSRAHKATFQIYLHRPSSSHRACLPELRTRILSLFRFQLKNVCLCNKSKWILS